MEVIELHKMTEEKEIDALKELLKNLKEPINLDNNAPEWMFRAYELSLQGKLD